MWNDSTIKELESEFKEIIDDENAVIFIASKKSDVENSQVTVS